jgi:hypothetical protein
VRAGVNTVVPDGPTKTPLPVEEFAAGMIEAPNKLPAAVEFEVFPTVDPTTDIPVGGTVVPK